MQDSRLKQDTCFGSVCSVRGESTFIKVILKKGSQEGCEKVLLNKRQEKDPDCKNIICLESQLTNSKMTKSIEDLNSEEVSKVDELRRRMKKDGMPKEMYDDFTVFRRFLRARSLNVDAAETMFRNHLAFRKRFDVENILTNWNAPPVLEEYFSLNNLGLEKDGTAVMFINFGELDFRGCLKCVRKDDVFKFVIKFIETILVQMKKYNETLPVPAERWKCILDFKTFSLLQATNKPGLEFLVQILSLYDLNYPERLKIVYFINVSFAFTIAWAVTKPILSVATLQKIKVFGKDGWQEELKNNFELDILPEMYGGNNRKKLIMGAMLPQQYYKYKSSNSMQGKENVKQLIVNRMDKTSVKLEVVHPGSKIEWEFEVKNRNIEFSLVYLGQLDSKVIEGMLPSRRVETNLETEIGMYVCNEPGIYAMVFDNTFSWIYGKEIFYKFAVVEPSIQNGAP